MNNSLLFISICIIFFFIGGIQSQTPPTITTVSSIAYGNYTSKVTIKGTNFVDTTTYSFNISTVPCINMVFVDTTQFICLPQSGILALSPYNSYTVSISFDNGPAVTKPLGFKFLKPSVSSIEQNLDKITIFGRSFYLDANGFNYMYAKFNNVNLTCSVVLTGKFTCDVVPGQYTLMVIDGEGNSYYNSSFAMAPLLESLDNNVFSIAPMVVTITGRFFASGLFVVQGSTTINATAISDTQAFYTTPLGISSPKSLSLQFGDVVSLGSPLTFTYQSPSIQSNFTPVVNDPTRFSISGNNFGTVKAQASLSLSGQSLAPTIVLISNNNILMSVRNTSKPSQLSIIVDGQVSNSIELNMKPKILSIKPPSIQGGAISITGNYLIGARFFKQQTTEIAPCSPIDNSGNNYPGTIICTGMPPGLGEFTVNALSHYGNTQDLNSGDFTGQYQSPIISDFNPSGIKLGGGVTQLEIIGSNFQDTSLEVTIGNMTCEVVSVTYSKITCTFTAPDGNIADFSDPIPVTVTVGGYSSSGNNTVYVYEPKECPGTTECSGHGACDYETGTCTCLELYTGSDCSQLKDENSSNEEASTSSHLMITFVINYLLISFVLFFY